MSQQPHDRRFQRIDGELHSSISPALMGTPGSNIGTFLGRTEDDMTLFYRAYNLGREDKAREVRETLGIREQR